MKLVLGELSIDTSKWTEEQWNTFVRSCAKQCIPVFRDGKRLA